MAGRPFSEDDLLDYVRGAAAPELSDRIEATTARDPALRAEIALMRGLKPALEGGDAGRPPGEFGWKRLEAAIRRGEVELRSTPSPRQVATLRIAAAVLAIAVLGQTAYIVSDATTAEDATYRTATEATAVHVLGIGFAPDAAAAEIGDLLRDVDARVIGGPSALGIYRVAFVSEQAMREAEARFRMSTLIDLVAEE